MMGDERCDRDCHTTVDPAAEVWAQFVRCDECGHKGHYDAAGEKQCSPSDHLRPVDVKLN